METNIEGTILDDCNVYGLSAWALQGTPKSQLNLIVTPTDEPVVTTDQLEVSQLIYTLLSNPKIKDVIDTVAKKAVLILGRFTDERIAVLRKLKDALRSQGYVPMLFDFEKPASRNLTETVSTLAHISRFVIADVTDAKSIPQELQRIVPDLPSLPVLPLILSSQHEYGMFRDLLNYPWVLMPHEYESAEVLTNDIKEIIRTVNDKANDIEERRNLIAKQLAERNN